MRKIASKEAELSRHKVDVETTTFLDVHRNEHQVDFFFAIDIHLSRQGTNFLQGSKVRSDGKIVVIDNFCVVMPVTEIEVSFQFPVRKIESDS